VNALALALLAIEVRARADVTEQIEKASAAYAGYLAAVITDGEVLDGNSLNSRADLHQARTMLFGAAQRSIHDSVATAYTAATTVARNSLVGDLAELGHDVPDDLGDLGATLTALEVDIDNAFGQFQTELQNGIRTAYDTTGGPQAARLIAARGVLDRASGRLRMRVGTSTTTAVHQGARDAQTAVFRRYADIHGYATVKKRWIVTSKDPCGMCRALHGTVADITAEFDRTANDGPESLKAVYLDLQGPPRHPNCRCQLELVVT
jgi:hypothetical protein